MVTFRHLRVIGVHFAHQWELWGYRLPNKKHPVTQKVRFRGNIGPMGPGSMGPGPMRPGPMGQAPMSQAPGPLGPMGPGPSARTPNNQISFLSKPGNSRGPAPGSLKCIPKLSVQSSEPGYSTAAQGQMPEIQGLGATPSKLILVKAMSEVSLDVAFLF